MKSYFESGETYNKPSNNHLMMVLAVESYDEIESWLAVVWVDRKTKEVVDADEVCVKVKDQKYYKKVEF